MVLTRVLVPRLIRLAPPSPPNLSELFSLVGPAGVSSPTSLSPQLTVFFFRASRGIAMLLPLVLEVFDVEVALIGDAGAPAPLSERSNADHIRRGNPTFW